MHPRHRNHYSFTAFIMKLPFLMLQVPLLVCEPYIVLKGHVGLGA